MPDVPERCPRCGAAYTQTFGEVEKLRSVIRDLLPIAEARVAWEEEYESDALSSTSWIEPNRRVIARAKEVLMRVGGGDGPSRQDQEPTA